MNYNYEIDIQIIRRLLTHITDFKMLYKGHSNKTYEEIEDELKETERMCEMYYVEEI